MKITGVNENYWVEIEKWGREGVKVEINDVRGSGMALVVDIEKFKEAIKEICPELIADKVRKTK